jgi:L-glyceraldehyde 3-phosphate reductase
MDIYTASQDRYDKMQYRRCGKSGILLPLLSLGLWHNFGDVDELATSRKLLRTAFDNGISPIITDHHTAQPRKISEGSLEKISFLIGMN